MADSDHIPELRVIPEYPDYAASADGDIWRVKESWRPNRKNRGHPPYKLKQILTSIGYLQVTIPKLGAKSLPVRVHRLIASAFHGECPSKCHEVAHYDGDRLNNKPGNLRWVTRAENVADAKRHGTFKGVKGRRGEESSRAILNEDQVRHIRSNVNQRGDIARIAREIGKSYSSVYQAYIGTSWAWLA